MKVGYLMQEGVPDIHKRPLSGPATHVMSVIQELQKTGHQISLLMKREKKIWLSDDLEHFELIQIPQMDQGIIRWFEKAVRHIQSEFKLPYANYFESLRFACACQQTLSDCDIYFERMGWLGYGGSLAAQKMHIPLVLEVNGDHLDELRSLGLSSHKSQENLSYLLMKKAASRVSHVVATGEGWRQKYIERWKVSPSKVTVIENGSSLVNLLRKEDLRAFQPVELGMPLRIVYCGGLEPWHGISILVRSVQKVIAQGYSIQVTLIGSGSEESQIAALIKEMGLQTVFTFTGQVAIGELARLLAQSDIGVSPYCGRVEYSGLKLLDYKAAGLATIASGKNGQPSVLKHNCTGYIVPPCDEEALTQAIITLAENPQLRTSIGRAARMEAESMHSWQHTIEQLLDLFERVKSNN